MTDSALHMLGHVSIKAEMKVVFFRNESRLFLLPFFFLSSSCFSRHVNWLCPQPYESLEENAKCVMSSFFQSTRSHSAYCRLQQVINDNKEFDLYRWKRSVFNWIQGKEEIRSQGSLETHVNCQV